MEADEQKIKCEFKLLSKESKPFPASTNDIDTHRMLQLGNRAFCPISLKISHKPPSLSFVFLHSSVSFSLMYIVVFFFNQFLRLSSTFPPSTWDYGNTLLVMMVVKFLSRSAVSKALLMGDLPVWLINKTWRDKLGAGILLNQLLLILQPKALMVRVVLPGSLPDSKSTNLKFTFITFI